MPGAFEFSSLSIALAAFGAAVALAAGGSSSDNPTPTAGSDGYASFVASPTGMPAPGLAGASVSTSVELALIGGLH